MPTLLVKNATRIASMDATVSDIADGGIFCRDLCEMFTKIILMRSVTGYDGVLINVVVQKILISFGQSGFSSRDNDDSAWTISIRE